MSAIARQLPCWALLFSSVVSAQSSTQRNEPSDVMRSYYSNTLVCRSSTAQCHIWFNQDGSYRQYVVTSGADGYFGLTGIEGRYTVAQKNGAYETCLLPRGIGGPMGGRATECYLLAGRNPGDQWTFMRGDTQVYLSLQPGRSVNAQVGFIQ